MKFLHSNKFKFEQVCSTNMFLLSCKFYHMILLLNEECLQSFIASGVVKVFLEIQIQFWQKWNEFKFVLPSFSKWAQISTTCSSYQIRIFHRVWTKIEFIWWGKTSFYSGRKRRKQREKRSQGFFCKCIISFPAGRGELDSEQPRPPTTPAVPR